MKTAKKRNCSETPVDRKLDPAGDETLALYLPLVRFVAEKIHRRLPPGIDLESLIHSGFVGLLEALERFDSTRGVDFKTYAHYRIQGEVMECLRSLDWVSRPVRAWGRKLEAARAKLTGELVREPAAEEMAKELAIPLENFFRVDQQVNGALLLSLEDLSLPSQADWKSIQQSYNQNIHFDPLSFVEDKDFVNKLAKAVNRLPSSERIVIALYYHEELTLREIGKILKLTEGRICQIFGKAVALLRSALGVVAKAKHGTKGCGERKRQAAMKPVRVFP
jgi:RNA polymerase sigma factor FliA